MSKQKNEEAFEKNWSTRDERSNNYWVKGEVKNQVQLAFRNHWEVFNLLMQSEYFNKGNRSLEVGCGRGSMSAYFCDTGYQCTLLDISPTVIQTAKSIFSENDHQASFVLGNVYQLPFEKNAFDIVFSIGLLEHLDDIENAIAEQVRVLDKGGLFIAYVVPENSSFVQQEFQWVNEVIQGYCLHEKSINISAKEAVYRTETSSELYLSAMKNIGLGCIGSSGTYPLPLISHSFDFPFSLMPEQSEIAITKYFKNVLKKREEENQQHPWLCDENYGQAFLVWGYK